MEFDNSPVQIIPLDEMEGLRFAVFYFDAPDKLYLSPSMSQKLQAGEQIQFVELSWPEKGRNIRDDAKVLVEEFKKMPTGQGFTFDVQEKQDEFDSQRTGKPRIQFSPKWRPN